MRVCIEVLSCSEKVVRIHVAFVSRCSQFIAASLQTLHFDMHD